MIQDKTMDEELHIHTEGRDDKLSDEHHHPYEATEYEVLDRIIESGYLGAEDVLVDFGCGKGRVPIYISHRTGCRAVGVEMLPKMYEEAMENLEHYKRAVREGKLGAGSSGRNNAHAGNGDWTPEDRISFLHLRAEQYHMQDDETALFFFNPFSEQILQSVLAEVVDSYYREPREIKLFFYYPSGEYVACLMSMDELLFADEIDCTDLFPERDDRNRVLVFQTM